jgi:3-hydroxybutyryl-CoA dehydrogenase
MAALSGYTTILFDAVPGVVETARASIESTMSKGIARGKLTEEEKDAALDRLRLETDLSCGIADADLVIEAIPEDLEAKKALFAEFDARCPETTVLASNTSSLSIASLAGATGRPDRVLGLHFFNPVHIMRLVEVVVTAETDVGVRDAMLDWVGSLGKQPIVVQDSPGFASSRLGLVLGLEAMRMLEEGVASAEDIDTAMELGYNHPMGPLKLTDLVGLDVRLAIADHLAETMSAERFQPPNILRRLVAEGHLGRKTGEGLYRWEDGKPVPKPHPVEAP